ncbi:AMP-binding protein [Pseudarthrobacter sp. NIBRBAC000502771]|uniref:AMP-binding protein n=1 Tax=Pseudarthrobacter sp. NIBRBAC000502771 TaxID=2590774 RepID=UPI00113190E7|nr:AMP-binding protein [Pseudarthrobacter sp. NIBRBAC000502771]QDG63814.1 AMP-binding protein [Pseudarthrobacter sp. NIBRBAC000502771]
MTLPLEITGVTFAAGLARHGDRPAILTGSRAVSYSELDGRVQDFAHRLGTFRRLVVLAADNSIDTLVAYLAALSSGHPLLLAPADNPAALSSLVAAYDPDVVIRPAPGANGTGALQLEEIRAATIHELHPDLALLISTSGSTGSPKLVRLSHSNLQSNAESIAEYLGITPDDRAMTTLPMYYCYGLSVINSHLLRGAALVLTGLSVVDECFWQLFQHRGATSFAAVPYTFELLDRAGFASRDLPTLRYITQAGGRLAPEAVTRYARLGRSKGWDLFIMYGQTEATARMAYLPPHLAEENPGTIGIPVPGGEFRIDPVPGPDDLGGPIDPGPGPGELVYSGPNVMLGYAQEPADLALGRTVRELRTGDLARQHSNGLFEVVGRRSRFVKIVGLRIDLGQVEKVLAGLGISAACTGTDSQLVAAVEGTHDGRMLAKMLAQELGLPRPAVTVHAVAELPRLATGKTDYPAVLTLAAASPGSTKLPAALIPGSSTGVGGTGAAGTAVADGSGTAGDGRDPAAGGPPGDVKRIFADALEREDIGDDDTFVSLGGDSLSYVAASLRLERALGHLPANWHVTPIKDLTPRRPSQPKRRLRRIIAPLETSIVLRAVAILTIISTHIDLIRWPGTAHVLVAVAGYNFARFQLGGERLPRFRRQLRSLARVVLPTVAFIGAVMLLSGDKFHYTIANLFLLNTMIGPAGWTDAWHFWFIEVLVYVLVGMIALLSIPWAHRAEKRFPLAFPLALVGLGLVFRYNLVPLDILHTRPVLWLFALGWAIARARTWPQRLALSILAALTLPGYFGDPWREATILAGILMVTWIPAIPLPRVLHRAVGVVASASLYIYVTHWVVFPDFKEGQPELALVLSVAAGIAYWAIAARIMGASERGQSRLWRRWKARRQALPA